MIKPSLHHIVTTPETVKSLIQEGIFPDEIPDYVSPKKIKLIKIFEADQFLAHSHKDQVFIVEVLTSPISVCKIDQSKITRVFVNSEKAKMLFNRLISGVSSIKVIITPSLFESYIKKEPSRKRKKEDDQEKDEKESESTYGALGKKLKSDIPVLPDQRMTSQTPDPCLLRLSNTEEHKQFLQKSFSRAKNQILMTSYSLKHETFMLLNLYVLMREARSRGVKIYIYYSDQKEVDDNVYKFLKHQGVFLDYTYTHSKLFVVDDNIVAIGSFNWFSGVTNRFPNACDGTIVFQDHDMCSALKEDIWKHIKRYRNHQFGNRKQIRKFDSQERNFAAIKYPIDKESSVVYLPTLEQQSEHLAESFEVAERSIVICSPFISKNGEFFEDFDHKTLRKLSKREIEIIFVCNAGDRNLKYFQNFLREKVGTPYVHLVLVQNFHLKTIIVDDEEICEGSFNWLSAVRDEESEFHNHEAALVVDGPLADSLIDHFYDSPVGEAIHAHFRELHSAEEDGDWFSSESGFSFG